MNGNIETARTALRDAQAAWERGDAAIAETRSRDAIAADGDDAAAWTLLGVVLRRRDPEAARLALETAIERSPKHPDAWFHLGNLHREAHRYADAVVAYETAARAATRSPSLHNNLGLALEGIGKPDRAEAAYRTALSLAPGQRQALGNLAHLLCAHRRYTEASVLCEEYLRRFLDAEAPIWIDRGICLHHAGDLDGAETSFERAVALDPRDAVAVTNLSSLLVERDEFARAEPLLSQVVALEPARAYPLSLLAHCRAHLCAWAGIGVLHTRLRELIESGVDDAANAFALLSTPLSAELQQRAACRWASDLAPVAAPVRPAPIPPRRDRLRVGYVSSDFRMHATASLLTEVWERHDRKRIATYAYSLGPTDRSALRSRIEAAFDHFADVSAESLEETIRRIRKDEIGVLIDLNGYTTHARSELFALRPAPIQVSWLGYLGTLGAPWYDYVLTDRFATPPELQRFFTERFLYLPDCYCPSDTRRTVASTASSRPHCGLPEQGFVFCCFNSTYKILPEVFYAWMRLLARVSGSVLWLSPAPSEARQNLRREAVAQGIDPERLIFAAKVPLPEHLARHVHADLYLDTMPYNAGAAANDALFMGVPLVTCAGHTLAGRVAGSQLRAIGLQELIATGLAEYEAMAMALAADPLRLTRMRAQLRERRDSSPLFDMVGFTRALDDLLIATSEDRLAKGYGLTEPD